MDARERLVAAMADLLWERGYVGTSPSAVLRRSGVGQGSLYHHFRGKQDLAVAAIEANAEVLRAAARATLLPDGHAYLRLERFLLRDRDVLRGCRIGRLTQDPEVCSTEELRRPVAETLRWIRQTLAEVVATGQARGELDDAVPADEVASAVLATLQGGYVLARAEQEEQRSTAAVRGVLALLRGLVRPRDDPDMPAGLEPPTHRPDTANPGSHA
ncbi:DNA-binding transcriptional regulator, AcrR family [Friedmanniella luteola]|uniref:DNA-binding transcriptional regulator, AcrR family n=1 Tax=Friedmanniella luteola TaxID=546871 RepID=A0A1H1UUV3_9ACTN|nr:TetR/AcrR family transcriptional regulator [Friedmanniella luteola]SDS76110.1 DNA-binding transcriptional regulator, AcrR family [Friedmanniella luteola]